MRLWFAIILIGCLQSCALNRAVNTLDNESPPQELGRPEWVRYSARTGSWLGGIGGLVLSIGTLPFTYPISVLADEPLGYSKQEFLYLPTAVSASVGHVAFGVPVDFLDWFFYRAWIDAPPPVDYEYTPQPPPASLVVPETTTEEQPTKTKE